MTRAAKISTGLRQEQIASAALDLMARHGPKSLNLATLAQKVGVVPSAIYRHYSAKDAVMEAVLDLIERRLRENVQAVRQETPDAFERLHRLLNRHFHLIRNNSAIPRIVFSEETFNGDSKRRKRVHRIIRSYLEAVSELIREGQEQGSIRADVPTDAGAVMFLGLIQPAVILWLTSDGAFDVGTHAHHAWRLFRQMLEAQPERRAVSGRALDQRSPAKEN
jgi:AcrR family transcriptional regulator